MVKPIRTIRVALLFGLLLPLLPWCGKTVSADTCLGHPRCGDCSTCVLNVREFGHYQTVWRRWPGDPRPAEVFPRSINAEVLPTPKPQRQQPLPRTRLHGPGEETFDTGPLDTLPGMPGTFPGEGGFLPQEPAFDFTPGIPEVPAESGGGSLLDPLFPETFPGVPAVPGVPGGPESLEPLPGMPLDPGSPTPFEPPLEQPFSTMPDGGAALPQLIPPSMTATEVPFQQPPAATAMPEEAVTQEAPQADAPPPELAAPDQSVAEATDVATDASPEPETVDTELPNRPELGQPEERTIQANWMAALHPGFRGETDRIASSYPSVGSAVAVEPDEVPFKEVPTKQETNALPVALGGYCPVELLLNERWAQSDPRWTATHAGRRYLFAGETQRQQFLDDPDRFTAVHSGNDPVLFVDDERRVPGRMDYCVTYEGRLYMFSMADTLARFQEKPERYTAKDE
ncbi:MAG: hypothetical protein V3R99_01725 [Thermoguttaceae bacterium]